MALKLGFTNQQTEVESLLRSFRRDQLMKPVAPLVWWLPSTAMIILRQFLTVRFRQSKTALFDWTFFRLDSSGPASYRQWSRFYSFCALPRGGWCKGVLLYCCMAVENRLAALSAVRRAFFASDACFARDEPSSKRVGGVGLSRKPPKLRLWRCAQPRAAKATAGVAVVGKMASIPRAAVVV